MAPTTLWPVVGALGAAGGTLGLSLYLWDRRSRPGAIWLLAVLGVQLLLTLSYGLGLLVFDPTLRLGVEMVFWICYIWLSTLFVAFGLDYTGRGHVIRSPWFGTTVVVSVVLTLMVVTNPLHQWVWAEFAVTPTAGLATVSFVRRGGAFVILGITMLGASLGTLLLVDTIISYGQLYRQEAFVVAVSPLPPGIGLVLWTFDVAPLPGLNVAPVLFVFHVIFDAYAFAGTGLFEFHPATRRAGNRAAIADLGNPVVVVDEHHRVVNLNTAAADAFDLASEDVLTQPFQECYHGDDIDPDQSEQDAEISVGRQSRVFKITSTGLFDTTDTHLGYTLVFQDITAERQREQRLAVLNRVLRHNLRNDLMVVEMSISEAIEQGGEEMAPILGPAQKKTDGLIDVSEKARAFERVINDPHDSTVSVADVVDCVVGTLREEYPAVTIAVETDESATLRTNPALIEVIVSNLVENAVEHGSTDGQAVTVTVEAASEAVTLSVQDHGPGIPSHELDVLDGDESALEHGSGLGLWLVTWSVTAVGGDLTFETDDGTTATVRFPVTSA